MNTCVDKFEMPQLSLKELLRRALKIQAIIRLLEQGFFVPQLTEEQLSTFNLVLELPSPFWRRVDDRQLTPICTIETFHSHCFFGFCGANVKEVLCQIPKKHLSQTVAFEITNWPNIGRVVKQPNLCFNTRIVRAETTLYATATPV